MYSLVLQIFRNIFAITQNVSTVINTCHTAICAIFKPKKLKNVSENVRYVFYNFECRQDEESGPAEREQQRDVPNLEHFPSNSKIIFGSKGEIFNYNV